MKAFKNIYLNLILLSLSLLSFDTSAQIRVFEAKGHYFDDLVLLLQNNRTFYPTFFQSDQQYLYTVRDNKIMEGGSGSEFDLLFTVKEGKLWRGKGFYMSDIAYTLRDGKIYKGDSSFLMDQLYTVKDNIIYLGHTSFATDALFYIEGNYTDIELYAILLSLDLIIY